MKRLRVPNTVTLMITPSLGMRVDLASAVAGISLRDWEGGEFQFSSGGQQRKFIAINPRIESSNGGVTSDGLSFKRYSIIADTVLEVLERQEILERPCDE
jgi:hypothetical protein